MRQQWAWAAGFGLIVVAQPSWAQDVSNLAKGDLGGANPTAYGTSPYQGETGRGIPRLRDMDRPATSLKQWQAQMDAVAPVGEITGVEMKATETGLQIVFTVPSGGDFQVLTTREKNTLTATIQNAGLNLTGDNRLQQENPTPEISSVEITPGEGNSIQIKVIGVNGAPRVQFQQREGQLIAGLTPTNEAVTTAETQATKPETKPDAETDDDIKIVVTGEGQQGYFVPNTSTVTRTDTPIRDIPQSIQVIPQQVLRDQQADVNTALRNAPSVRNAAPSNFSGPRILVRGFFSSPALDGFVNRIFNGVGANIGPDLTGIDRLEVIAGPSAATFGALSAGGTVNYVTKRPLSDPSYLLQPTFGNYGLYLGEVDFTGPLDPDKKVLYRLNASYRSQDSFLENSNLQNLVIAPVISVVLGKNTTFSVESVYKDLNIKGVALGLPAVGTVLPNPIGQIPRNRNINEGEENVNQFRITAGLDHRFSDAWSFNTRFRFDSADFDGLSVLPGALAADNRTLPRSGGDFTDLYREYRLQTNVVGRFSTGFIKHEVLFGLDLGRNTVDNRFVSRLDVPSIDIFNPILGQPLGTLGGLEETFLTNITTDEIGILLQNQIAFADNLKLLLTGRFDAFTQTGDFDSPTQVNAGNAFSPRVGIVYQPIQPVSLYAVFAQSFEPNLGASASNTPFQPRIGTQFEVGVKADISPQLAVTLALYDITVTNVLTPDPANPNFGSPSFVMVKMGRDRVKRRYECNYLPPLSIPKYRAVRLHS